MPLISYHCRLCGGYYLEAKATDVEVCMCTPESRKAEGKPKSVRIYIAPRLRYSNGKQVVSAFVYIPKLAFTITERVHHCMIALGKMHPGTVGLYYDVVSEVEWFRGKVKDKIHIADYGDQLFIEERIIPSDMRS